MNPTTPVLTQIGLEIPQGLPELKPLVRIKVNGIVHDLDENAMVRLNTGEWIKSTLLTPKTRIMPAYRVFTPHVSRPLSDEMGPYFAYGVALSKLKVGERVDFMGRPYHPLRPRTPAQLAAFRAGFGDRIYTRISDDPELIAMCSLVGLFVSDQGDRFLVSGRNVHSKPKVGLIERTTGPLLTYAPGEYLLPAIQIKIPEVP